MRKINNMLDKILLPTENGKCKNKKTIKRNTPPLSEIHAAVKVIKTLQYTAPNKNKRCQNKGDQTRNFLQMIIHLKTIGNIKQPSTPTSLHKSRVRCKMST